MKLTQEDVGKLYATKGGGISKFVGFNGSGSAVMEGYTTYYAVSSMDGVVYCGTDTDNSLVSEYTHPVCDSVNCGYCKYMGKHPTIRQAKDLTE